MDVGDEPLTAEHVGTVRVDDDAVAAFELDANRVSAGPLELRARRSQRSPNSPESQAEVIICFEGQKSLSLRALMTGWPAAFRPI